MLRQLFDEPNCLTEYSVGFGLQFLYRRRGVFTFSVSYKAQRRYLRHGGVSVGVLVGLATPGSPGFPALSTTYATRRLDLGPAAPGKDKVCAFSISIYLEREYPMP